MRFRVRFREIPCVGAAGVAARCDARRCASGRARYTVVHARLQTPEWRGPHVPRAGERSRRDLGVISTNYDENPRSIARSCSCTASSHRSAISRAEIRRAAPTAARRPRRIPRRDRSCRRRCMARRGASLRRVCAHGGSRRILSANFLGEFSRRIMSLISANSLVSADSLVDLGEFFGRSRRFILLISAIFITRTVVSSTASAAREQTSSRL